jgi:hypothetical protein
MAENYKVPSDELTGESNLNGRYRVSFNIEITDNDCIALSDIVQSLASGLNDDPILYKISDIGLEKLTKEGMTDLTPKTFKVGDPVVIKEDVTIKVAVGQHNGLFIVGAKSLSVEPIGEVEITIPQGTHAIVNQVTASGIELIDFDTAVSAPFENQETGEIEDISLGLESVILLNIDMDTFMEEEQ